MNYQQQTPEWFKLKLKTSSRLKEICTVIKYNQYSNEKQYI